MISWRIDDVRAVLSRLVANEMRLLPLSDNWFVDFEQKTGISPSSARMRMQNFLHHARLPNGLSHIAKLDKLVFAEFVAEGRIPGFGGVSL